MIPWPWATHNTENEYKNAIFRASNIEFSPAALGLPAAPEKVFFCIMLG